MAALLHRLDLKKRQKHGVWGTGHAAPYSPGLAGGGVDAPTTAGLETGATQDSRSGDQRYSLALSEGESDECLLLEFVRLG